MISYHKPVLLQPACAYLNIAPGKKYIDATLGGGGHAQEIISQGGIVLGLDQDPDSLSFVPDQDSLTKVRSNFVHLKDVAIQYGFFPCDGIIFDLGISSHQIDTGPRGFSFQKDGPLDMRMDPSLKVSAKDLVNDLPVSQLAHIFKVFGEVKDSGLLAKKIAENRPLHTTQELAKLTGRETRPAFQALRIAVNDELGSLEIALPQAVDCLKTKGILVVITFHSLEDLIVKNFMGPSQISGPIFPTDEEIRTNPRSKSAKLRVFKKL